MKLLIKLGGTLLESDETRQAVCRQIAGAQAAGHQTVVVHGGGKRLSRYLEDQGIESEFRNGFRVTAPEIMDAVLRIFCGSVNHHLVAELGRAGAKPIGLSGIDAGIVQAVQLAPELGAVGQVSRVNPAPLGAAWKLSCAPQFRRLKTAPSGCAWPRALSPVSSRGCWRASRSEPRWSQVD